jgi:hypothetical protein
MIIIIVIVHDGRAMITPLTPTTDLPIMHACQSRAFLPRGCRHISLRRGYRRRRIHPAEQVVVVGGGDRASSVLLPVFAPACQRQRQRQFARAPAAGRWAVASFRAKGEADEDSDRRQRAQDFRCGNVWIPSRDRTLLVPCGMMSEIRSN